MANKISQAFDEYTADMEPFHKLDALTKAMVKSFFIGGYLFGMRDIVAPTLGSGSDKDNQLTQGDNVTT